jgi:DNA polymerase
MFVGQNPGKDEDKAGKPFVGQAGNWLMRMLQAIGHEREEVYITNTVKCWTPDNRLPSLDEMKNCYHWLTEEAQIVKPKLVIPMGAVALQAVLGAPPDIRITEWHGVEGGSSVSVFKEAVIFPVYHPAVLLYNYERNYPVYCNDLVKLIKLLERMEIVTPNEENWQEDFAF